jgi:transposase
MPSDAQLEYDVVRLSRDGMSARAIARALHVSRNTVRAILEGHGDAREQVHSALRPKRAVVRPSQLDTYRPKLEELLRTYPDITAQRVYETLRAETEFRGGYTGVKDLVRRIRPKPAPTPSLQTPPREPGDLAESDWATRVIRFTHAPSEELQVFGYTLRYSTRKYYGFHESKDIHALMDGHRHVFNRFEGAARRVKYDVQKPAVLRWEGNQPIYNPRFVDFATYYEMVPVACRPRRPNEKPRVERSFWELDRSFLNGRSFRDRADLERQCVEWLDTIADLRPLKRMKRRTRLELFAEEKPLLRPLPRHPYDTARVLYKLCDLEGFIAYEGNWYSLPYEDVTQILPVRVTEHELFVYRPDLTCIARHALLPRGGQQRSTLDGHRPRHAERGPDLDQLRLAYRDLGDVALEYLAALERHEPRSAGYHARQVLLLREGYDTADLLRALEHALAYGALQHGDVGRILVARSNRRRLDEYVAEASAQKLQRAITQSCTEPRDLTEYDALPCRGVMPFLQGEALCPSEPTPSAAPAPPPTSGKESSNTSNGSA